MKPFTTHSLLIIALIALLSPTVLQAQTSDAPVAGESITIQLASTKDKILSIGVFTADKDAWIDINGDGICQDSERIGRSTERPADYTDVFYAGPDREQFELVDTVQTIKLYGKIEALRIDNSETGTTPIMVDLSQCTNLLFLKLYECAVLDTVKFPLPENNGCEVLIIQHTPMTSLDLSDFEDLIVLVARDNKALEEITLGVCDEMAELDLSFTNIREIDLSKVAALTDLYLCQTQISQIDLSQTPQLEHLSLGANYLTQVDLSKVPLVYYLSLFDNELTEVDLSKLPMLETLELEQNKLQKVDLSKNSLLKSITIHNNKLTELDLSQLTNLHLITLQDNNISEELMGQIVAKLPQCKVFDEEGEDEYTDMWGHFYVVNTPSPTSNVCNRVQVAKIREQGWTPMDVNGSPDPQDYMLNAVEYEGSTPSGVCMPLEQDRIDISYTARQEYV